MNWNTSDYPQRTNTNFRQEITPLPEIQNNRIQGEKIMKYEVLMSCGHKETVELLGKHEDRNRKIKYFEESGLCKECYKKAMQEKEKKILR